MRVHRLLWLVVVCSSGALLALGCSEEPLPSEQPATDETLRSTIDLDEEGVEAALPHFPFADAEVFFEFNSTDNDLGFQVFVDGEAWKRLKLFDPDGDKILQINARGPMKELGLTELLYESAEPSPAEVLDLFPPGEYEFRGRSVDGEVLYGSGELSHDLPDPPVFSPSGDAEVSPNNVVVIWDEVPGAETYEIIVSNEEPDEAGHDLSIIVGSGVQSLHLPPTFFEPDTEYKAEVLARGENGNRTITEGFFSTTDGLAASR